jgi:phosphoadenosine phosphosulfate reductase
MTQALSLSESDALELVAAEVESAAAPCVTSSFQAECVVLVHMLQQVRPRIPVLFLDTVHHFPQTLAYRDEIASKWGLNLITLRAAEPAPGLWQQDLKACCGKHKVQPLSARSSTAYLVHRTSPRPVPDPRAGSSPSSRSRSRPARRFADQPAGALEHEGRLDVPRRIRSLLPLYELGYTSIGCEPCTSLGPVQRSLRSLGWTETGVRITGGK